MDRRFDRPTTSRTGRPRGGAVPFLLRVALLFALAGAAFAASATAARRKPPKDPAAATKKAPPPPPPHPVAKPESDPSPPEVAVAEHLIGPEDLLEISVFEVPQLSRTVRVSEAGSISLPLLGELPVSGLTVAQLETRLREALSKGYVEDPQVSVFVKEYSSRKVSVIGAVGNPGVYELLGPRTLLEVLSQAGGFTERSGAKLYILRNVKGDGQRRIIVNVSDLMEKGDQAHNVSVEPGDIISVPIDRPAYVFVDGAVRTPGRVDQLASRPLSLLQAIARAGGPTDRADIKEIQILRRAENGEQTILSVNLKRVRKGKDPDLPLRDGDIIVVRESFF